MFIYKGMNWKGVWHALSECINTLSIVLILIATSSAFGYCLTILHVPSWRLRPSPASRTIPLSWRCC